jgi:hypothetical protein
MSTESATEQAEAVIENLRNFDGDVMDWLEGTLDVRRTYSSDKALRSVNLLVGFGGPNIWVEFDGHSATVEVTWYCEPVTRWVECPELSEQVLELFDNWAVTD